MSWSYVEKDWDRLETQVRREWEALTDDDFAGINGKYDRLVSRVQQRYDIPQDEARRQVNEWAARLARAEE